MGRLNLCILVGLTCAACEAGDGPAADDIDSASVLRLDEVARIGSRDDPDRGFSHLTAVHVDSDGNVYAMDAMAYQIRVFDRDGELVRSIGRRGRGPGEWEEIPRFGIRGDTLWTYNFPPGRITLFTLEGSVISTSRTIGWPSSARNGTVYLTPVSMRADGGLVTWIGRLGYAQDPEASSSASGIPRVVFDVHGSVIDTAGRLPGPPPRFTPPEGSDRGRWQTVTIGAQTYSVPDPPTTLAEWLPFDSGYVVVDVPVADSETGSFTVTRIQMDGDTQFHRVLRYRAQPYTEEQLQQAAAQQPIVFRNGEMVRPQMDESVVRAIRAKMDFPPYQLPVQSMWLSNDESVWLSRRTNDDRSRSWLVLTPEGEIRGQLQLPSNARPLWHRGSTAYASVPDDTDVPWLVRFRLGT